MHNRPNSQRKWFENENRSQHQNNNRKQIKLVFLFSLQRSFFTCPIQMHKRNVQIKIVCEERNKEQRQREKSKTIVNDFYLNNFTMRSISNRLSNVQGTHRQGRMYCVCILCVVICDTAVCRISFTCGKHTWTQFVYTEMFVYTYLWITSHYGWCE